MYQQIRASFIPPSLPSSCHLSILQPATRQYGADSNLAMHWRDYSIQQNSSAQKRAAQFSTAQSSTAFLTENKKLKPSSNHKAGIYIVYPTKLSWSNCSEETSLLSRRASAGCAHSFSESWPLQSAVLWISLFQMPQKRSDVVKTDQMAWTGHIRRITHVQYATMCAHTVWLLVLGFSFFFMDAHIHT